MLQYKKEYVGMYNVQLSKWGILQVREQTQIEKGVRNLPCYIVEAQIPGKIYNNVTWTDTTVTITWLWDI
jgi:hypothetical protein